MGYCLKTVFFYKIADFEQCKGHYRFLKVFNAHGWGWTLWTYKVCLENSGWGLYNGLKRAPENVVTPRDDHARAAAKWGRVATADSFARNEWLAKVLRENAIPAPAAPAPRER